MSHNLEGAQSLTLRAFFRCDTMSTRRIVIFLVLQGMGYTLCGRKQLVFMTIDQIFGDNLISSCCLSTELLGGLRGQAASAQEASIHPDLPSAHFTPKSCHLIGRARSRWQMLASDWSRLALLGCRGQCGNFRKWKHPSSTADLNSWAATERGRVGKSFSMHGDEKDFSTAPGMSRSDFAVCNNKQAFFPLIYYHWATLGSYFCCVYSARFVPLFLSSV